MDKFIGNALSGMFGTDRSVPNLINEFIGPVTMKALYKLCLQLDIADNNDKAEIAREIMGPDFVEVGTGTNRIAFRYHGLVVKVALDRRGLVDNHTEFKRSIELPQFLAKTYETNYLINICEYIEVMDQDTFIINERAIKEMLAELSKNYLFEDLGFTMKNSYNWGCREAALSDDERSLYKGYLDDVKDVCILDYGYLYPLHDQGDKLLRCAKCNHRLTWNTAFTGFNCTNSQCNFQISPTDIRRRMRLDYEEMENQVTTQLNNLKMPNLTNIEQDITKI